MKHISQHVDRVRQLLTARQTSLPLIQNLLRRDGCPEDQIMPCIYGHCAEALQDRLGSPQQCEEHPELLATEAECFAFLKAYCPELTDEEIEAIFQKIQSLGRIAIVEDYVYSLLRPAVNLPLEINS